MVTIPIAIPSRAIPPYRAPGRTLTLLVLLGEHDYSQNLYGYAKPVRNYFGSYVAPVQVDPVFYARSETWILEAALAAAVNYLPRICQEAYFWLVFVQARCIIFPVITHSSTT
jgi:hypothetical protein